MDGSSTLWLTTSAGIRLPIKAAGVLLGRSPHCDVVLTASTASRVQAIVFAGVGGACLSVLGRGKTTVNGEAIEHDCDLAPGDRIELPGLTASIISDAGDLSANRTWLVRGPGGLFGVVRSPFLVGAGNDTDLRLLDGPIHLLSFHVDESDRPELEVEACSPIRVGDEELAIGGRAALGSGSSIVTECGVFEIVEGAAVGQAPTQRDLPAAAGPRRVQLEFLARGGRLTFEWHGCRREVYLPERRCDLVAALLQPPSPFVAGDFVPDDVLLPRVWPNRAMTRVDLNTVLHRARQDLARAAADAGALLARAEGGNATRFVITRDADITIV